MSQSAVLVASLVAAFVLYVAARGRLETYAAAVLGQVAPPKSSGSGGGQKPDPSAVLDPGSWAKAADNMTKYAKYL